MIFSDQKRTNKSYGGANDKKKGIYINGEKYLVKIQSTSKRNPNLSYNNGVFSEYIGCHIFELLGFNTQKTILGTWKEKNKTWYAVACKDFEINGLVLQPFAYLKNQELDSSENGYGVELSEIIDTFKNQTVIDYEKLNNFFWDMFIVDAFIGNPDRHNGNWGFLYDVVNDIIVDIAPIYDCGSSLYAHIDEEKAKMVLENEDEVLVRIYNYPFSNLRINNNKIVYIDFINDMNNLDCVKALLRMVPKIDLVAVDNVIDNTPYISDTYKKFYKLILHARYERILLPAFIKANEINKTKIKTFQSEVTEATAKQETERDASASDHKTKGMSIPEK